ncbi:peptidoglycan-binding domain-containing protein [Flexibacterium corallicola]|uniref:peptidoglycan-binding domain-containing protein n=1 Tax=Flexibacterium corallicola TaxID=3037259 RepID=UPI00286EB5FB|nr:peptidoglycan-binding domain-containing protein [Pseudovibrio sp. M1P-2-3]
MARRKSARPDLEKEDIYEDESAFVEYEPDRTHRPMSKSFRSTVSIMMVLTGGLIVANAAFFQNGKHPAPLFETRERFYREDIPELVAATTDPQRLTLVKDVQRELRRLAMYTGSIDGMEGPATQQAVRAYQRSRKLNESGRINEALLARLTMDSNVNFEAMEQTPIPRLAPNKQSSRAASGTIEQVLEAAREQNSARAVPPTTVRVKNIQKALADLGYGPLEIDGINGGETAAAVRKFQRDHGLIITGQVEDRFIRKLKTLSGVEAL